MTTNALPVDGDVSIEDVRREVADQTSSESGTGCRSVFFLRVRDFLFNKPGQPVGQTPAIRVREFFCLLFQLAIDAKIDDFFFCHCTLAKSWYTICIYSVVHFVVGRSMMQYQSAKDQLASPPTGLSYAAMSIEASALIAAAMIIAWVI